MYLTGENKRLKMEKEILKKGCSYLNFPFPRKTFSLFSPASRIQRLKIFELIPKLLAASGHVYPCSVTKLIASNLNSFVYFLLVDSVTSGLLNEDL